MQVIYQQLPFLRNIVYIKGLYIEAMERSNYSGTGTVIQQGIILSCAHLLQKNKIQANEVYFYYKENIEDELRQQYKIKVKSWRYMKNHLEKKEDDFAIMYFEQKPKIKFFDKLILNWDQQLSEIKKEILQKYLCGYSRLSQNLYTLQNRKLFGAKDKNFQIDRRDKIHYTQNPNLLYYPCSITKPGQSGSSIVCLMKNGDYQIIGIHTMSGKYYHYGIRLRQQLHKIYKNWVKQLKSSVTTLVNLEKAIQINQQNEQKC